MFKPPTCTTVLTVALAASACEPRNSRSSAADGARGVTVRDSAGIEIVENHAPEHPAGDFWTIDPEPEIVLGGEEVLTGGANDSIQLVWDVVGVARVADGRVAVLSGEGRQLLLFEPSGGLSRTIGGPGEGPGEFLRPVRLQYLPPDTLVVWDYFMRSIAHFDLEGRLIGERLVDFPTLMDRVPGVGGESMEFPLPDGSFVAAKPTPGPYREPAPATLLRRFAREFVRVDHDYAAYLLGSSEGMEMWVPRVPVPNSLARVPTISADFSIVAGGRPPAIYVSDGIRNEIRQLSLDGTPVRLIRRTTDPLPITRAARRAWEESFLSLGEMMDESAPPGLFDGMPVRESFPPVGGMIVDTEGYLWVKEWSDSESGLPDQWSVFGTGGRWLGTLPEPQYPVRFNMFVSCHWRYSPCWIDRDFFLAVRRDGVGVERVEGYRIRRGEREAGE